VIEKMQTAVLFHYVVDARSSRFTVQAFASGILSAMGHNPVIGIRTFTGEVEFSPEAAQASSFRLSMKSNSLGVLDDVSDKDRRDIEKMMNEQVLEPARYPDIVYDSSSVSIARIDDALFSANLNGSLTFRGITRNQTIPARIAVFDEMFRASG
jgi:polyisoprenoid-binding protein YceI